MNPVSHHPRTKSKFNDTNVREIPISSGFAELDIGPKQVTVYVNGVPSSAVDLTDPTFLTFEYMQQMDTIIDHLHPEPKRILHLGAGACSLAWAWAIKHPTARQIAVDIDAELVALVRQWFELPRAPALRIRVQDAAAAVAEAKPDSFDVVVRDVFAGNTTPQELTTPEFTVNVQQALTSNGIYLVNCADRPPLNLVRQELITLKETFGLSQVALVAERGIVNGKRYGNLVLVARKTDDDEDSNSAKSTLENPALARALRSLPTPAVFIEGAELVNFIQRRKLNI